MHEQQFYALFQLAHKCSTRTGFQSAGMSGQGAIYESVSTIHVLKYPSDESENTMILQSHQIPHACTAEYESALRLCKRPLVQMHAASFSSRSESSPPMLEFQTLAACILTYIRSPTTASAAMANDCKYMTALFYVRIIGSGASSALPAMTLLETLRISLYNCKYSSL